MSDDGFFLKELSTYISYLTLLIGLYVYNSYKHYPFYKYFIIYIINIIFFHIISNFFFSESNLELYNIYTFFEFNIFSLIYYHLIKDRETLKILKILVLLFNVIYFVSFFIVQLNIYTVSIEGFFNSIFIILFFRELLNSERILNYKKLLPFWISVGFLVFYLATIPFFTLLYSKLFNSRIMFPILYSLIIVFHLCFIYGLVTCKKKEI